MEEMTNKLNRESIKAGQRINVETTNIKCDNAALAKDVKLLITD